jgi:hypothetical protein
MLIFFLLAQGKRKMWGYICRYLGKERAEK